MNLPRFRSREDSLASIERTAYPRFRHEPNARELQDLFTPTQEEVQFGRTLVRSDEHFFAVVVLLKCLQYLGPFPELAGIPGSIVDAFGLDPDRGKDKIVLVGPGYRGPNSALLNFIFNFVAPQSLGQAVTLLYNMYARIVSPLAAVSTPDVAKPGGGIFVDGADEIIFNNGWPNVNLTLAPSVGVVIVTNAKAYTFAAQTMILP